MQPKPRQSWTRKLAPVLVVAASSVTAARQSLAQTSHAHAAGGPKVPASRKPEALIYEPMPNGALRLVGVEFIVFASDWADLHPDGSAPAVDGHLANYESEPNRYGLHAFYELHVGAWQQNPIGTFADWNTRVSCDHQPG
jgi:hypothetical protein